MSAKLGSTKNRAHRSRISKTVLALLLASLLSNHAHAADLQGFGTDIPLSFAVQQIVPVGYDVSFGPSVNQTAIVSWKGGAPWQTVLTELFQQNHLNGQFNGIDLLVNQDAVAGGGGASISLPGLSIGSASASVSYEAPVQTLIGAPSIATQKAGTQQSGVDVNAAYVPPPGSPYGDPDSEVGFKAIQTSAASAAPLKVGSNASNQTASYVPDSFSSQSMQPAAVWPIQSGQLIGKAISDWATKAGWTVTWQLNQDWAVPADTQFTGTFQDAATKLVTEMAQQGADIRAKFYTGNHMLVVYQPGATANNAP